MKIYSAEECPQKSPQWKRLRAWNFTSSELGPFALEPVKIALNVDQIGAKLDELGINRKGVKKRDDLLALLPNPELYKELSPGAKTAIISKIKQERVQRIRDNIAKAMASGEVLQMSAEEDILFAREEELAAKEEKQFSFNIPVNYGNMLEPFARAFYQDLTGFKVHEVGFVEYGYGMSGFGCSPDGLVSLNSLDNSFTNVWHHGVEIKCPIPETHIAWLLDGTLPDEHKIQVHACMAVTGLSQWDFLSYCPGESPLLLTVERDDFTNQLEAGLKTLVEEKAKMKRVLADKWEASQKLRTIGS